MRRGFTLIEMVVVLAVIAILSAILIPSIEKMIKDSRIARAQNETQVIAAAIVSFYSDVGRWPNTDGSDPELIPNLYILYGPGQEGIIDGLAPIYRAWWKNHSSNPDAFENHLITNSPGGQAVNVYPTTGELRWRGPYITKINPDPWGRHYSCNIRYTYYVGRTEYAVFVWSAGPNALAETPFYQDRFDPNTNVRGDDIGTRLR